MSAFHYGRFTDLPEPTKDEALWVSALTGAMRSLSRREQLGIADDAYWPTCAIFVSLQEAQALLAAIPERRWPESTRALRRELQTLVREGQATRP